MIVKRQYTAGWLPDNDAVNGNPEGLLRSDNLTQDEIGIFSLTRGTQIVSSGPFTAAIQNIYSRVNNNRKLRYVHAADGSVLRNYGSFNAEDVFDLGVLSGGDTGFCSFGTGFGHNLICSGNQKFKDDGTLLTELGIVAPPDPGVSANDPPHIDVSGRFEEGLAAITAATEAAPCTLTVAGHGFINGEIVRVSGFTGENWSYVNNDWIIAVVDGNNFTVPIVTSGFDAFTGSPMVKALTIFSDWDATAENDIIYDFAGNFVHVDANLETLRAVVQRGFTVPLDMDTTAFQGVSGSHSAEDIFKCHLRVSDTNKLIKVRIDFLLDAPTSTPAAGSGSTSDIDNYYWFEWTNRETVEFAPDSTDPDLISYNSETGEIENLVRTTLPDVRFTSTFQQGLNVWTTLSCKRSNFNRVGNDDLKSWTSVKGIRVTANFTDTNAPAEILFNELTFEGSILGPLTGTYVYIQVDVNNTGAYYARSVPSEFSDEVTVYNSSVIVSPSSVAGQCNECWIYRAGGTLNGFYRVKVLTGAGGFTPTRFIDNLSDTDAILQKDQTNAINFNLAVPPDNIIDMEGPFYDRMWYLTTEFLFPTFQFNPDGYDFRTVIRVGAQNNEIALFIKKVSNDTMLVGTTNDIYEITGDATEIAPGILNINKRSLGVKQPPTSRRAAVYNGSLIYFSRDGWMMLQGSNLTPLVGGTSLLYRDEDRHGIPPVRVPTDGTPDYPVVTSKSRLFCAVDHLTLGRAVHVFNFNSPGWRFWRPWDDNGRPSGNNPNSLFVEEDGTILSGTSASGDLFLRVIDTGTLLDGTIKQPFVFRTVFDGGEDPKRRKDSFTLRIEADSGNDIVQITLRGLDDTSTVVEHSYNAEPFDGKTTKYYDINAVIGIVKRYQLEISATATSTFKLYDFCIDYDLRPHQLNYLRIPPSNYQVAGRKRIPEIPMVIDTMGNSVVFTPLLDNIAQIQSTIVTTDKTVFNYQFVEDKAAVNIGGILQGPLFEFYELVTPREVEVLPDPLKFKHIPYSNLGTGSRKRFIQYAFVIDTRDFPVIYTPLVDGIILPQQVFNTNRKTTVIYTFIGSVVGVDVGGTLQGDEEFEYYGLNLEECISEKLPPISQFLHIPYNNMGTSARKRFVQYAFVIDTRGFPVVFAPFVDATGFETMIVNTNRKQTVIYTFDRDATGVDIHGTLTGYFDFEFYGINMEESVFEKLPPLRQFIHLACDNFGHPAKKRVRTWPFVMDTKGLNVVFTPEVDGVPYPPTTFNTTRKQTVFHYFTTDSFGVDYCGTFTAPGDWEFYESLRPVAVEVLPVAKMFDQLGPVELPKVGKCYALRLILIPTNGVMNWTMYKEDIILDTGSFTTFANRQERYVIKFQKFMNAKVFRFELSAPTPFHRISSELEVNLGGNDTEKKRIKLP